MTMNRVSYIAHVDMDAFFASVEQATNPSLKGKPIIVTGSALRHSVVTAASYEAKRHGVKSGMTVLEASKLCPEAIPVEVDGKKYEYYSETVMKMLQEMSPSVAISSIDEAFVDLSYFRNIPATIERLNEFRKTLKKRLDISASIGIATNPIIAKMASDFRKPNGFTFIQEGFERAFLENIPVSDVPGIGKHTTVFLRSHGFESVGDLLKADEFYLFKNLGNSFLGLVKSLSSRIFNREAFFRKEAPKSMGHSMTFGRDVSDPEKLENIISFLGSRVIYRMRKEGYESQGIGMYVKYTDMSVSAISKKLSFYLSGVSLMNEIAHWLLKKIWNGEPVRAMGINCQRLRRLGPSSEQIHLFEMKKDPMQVALNMEDRFGKYMLFPASILSATKASCISLKNRDLFNKSFGRGQVSRQRHVVNVTHSH